ncbi:MAG: hypothetical protein KDG55_05780 [Rhodocyclaceae bacterium]|nr:hypothetical protein [Rhodocyclaceae bacterium]
MLYVRRDGAGSIVSVSLVADEDHPEAAEAGSADVQRFVGRLGGANPIASTDLGLVRVIEDLIDLLIARDLIRFTDLPDAAQEKLMERRSMRRSNRSLDLIPGNNEVL